MTYRILSLDGGGTWSLIQVRALMKLYGDNTSGHDVLRRFDMAAANSGGSLVLGGLVEDLTLKQLLGYFKDEEKRQSIFSPTPSWRYHILRKLTGIGPKYSAAAKLVALRKLLPKTGDLSLHTASEGIEGPGGMDVHLLIPAFDYDTRRAVYFRSAEVRSREFGRGPASPVTLAQAIHASANPPVNYYDRPAQFPDHSRRFWDGAIAGNNNPVDDAVIEARVLGHEFKDIAALSLGTGSVTLPLAGPGAAQVFERPRKKPGLLTDLRKVAGAILDDPPDAASFNAYVMTPGNIVRMSPLIGPVRSAFNWVLPSGMTPEQFEFLKNIDADALTQKEVTAIDKLATLWMEGSVRNQPIRMSSGLTLEVGDRTFDMARRRWDNICRPG